MLTGCSLTKRDDEMNSCLVCKYGRQFRNSSFSWDGLFEGSQSYRQPYRPYQGVLPNGATFEVVERVKDNRPDDGYGEYPQGSEAIISLVVRVDDPDDGVLYLRKEGTADSYGSVTWDGDLTQVYVSTKTLYFFENRSNDE